ncbi:hypothetical protein C451_00365 [Halococcus thailandensis JCM 13552]|uniref:Uncharacterized protein n=2 Tax=Halococcus thailandensis TaxID=335952 RepID=M0NGW9_9EURY|nr:hypothetical protein C451_00365 [Halococcus thailandensis JCM 13552]
MYLDGHIIVFNQKQFEDGFNYVDHFFDQSEDILDEIEAGPLNVTNMDDFRGWISNDRRKARKICQLSEFGIIDELDMSTATDIIDVHSLGLDITNGTGGSEISVPNGNKAWDMIKLLNNDHLVSPVNSEEFQATGGKRRPPE